MTDIRCRACNELNDYNAFKCENCKEILSDSNISEGDICENDYRFIEEAELNGDIYKLENLNEDSLLPHIPSASVVLKDENTADFNDNITQPNGFPNADTYVDEALIVKPETMSINLERNETASEPPYQCNQCSKSFKRRATLKAHINRDHINDSASLYIDNKSKTKLNAASPSSSYSSDYTPSAYFECKIRKEKPRSQYRTKRKTKTFSDDSVSECTTSANGIKTNWKLNNNVSNIKHNLKSNLVYKCTACEKITQSYEEHRKHIVIHQAPPDSLTETTSLEKLKQTPSGFIKCKECECVFMTQRDHMLHQKIHQKGDIFQCDICSAVLCNRSSLRKHKTRLHKRKPSVVKKEKSFECIICHKKFPAQILMTQHRRTHTDVIKKLEEMTIIEKREGKTVYVCKICAKTSKNKYRHEEHIRIHTGEKPYKCEQCGACISTANALVHHLRLHKDDRPFKCDICEATYRHKKSLKKHLIIHTGEKRFKCRYCVKKFAFNYTRADHERHCHINVSQE